MADLHLSLSGHTDPLYPDLPGTSGLSLSHRLSGCVCVLGLCLPFCVLTLSHLPWKAPEGGGVAVAVFCPVCPVAVSRTVTPSPSQTPRHLEEWPHPCSHTNYLCLFWPPSRRCHTHPVGKGTDLHIPMGCPFSFHVQPSLVPLPAPSLAAWKAGTWATLRVLGLQRSPGESRSRCDWRTSSYRKSSTVNPTEPENELPFPSAFVVPTR